MRFRAWDGQIMWQPEELIDSFPTDLVPLLSTGITDEDGIEIFEGDIVEMQLHDRVFLTGKVERVSDGLTLFGASLIECPYKLKVIGNIYEQCV